MNEGMSHDWNERRSCDSTLKIAGEILDRTHAGLFSTNNWVKCRAGRYISCDMHAHLVSKAGSLISG